MSNESPSPPPLRLKPRLSPVLPPSSAEPEGLRQPPPAVAPPAILPPALQVPPAVLAPDAIQAAPAPSVGAEDPGKFKLKPRALVAPPLVPSVAAVEVAPATPIQIPPVTTPIVKPVMPAAALASPAFAKPAAPPGLGRPNMPISTLPPGALTPLGRPSAASATDKADNAIPAKAGLGVIIGLIVVALGVFGFLGYRFLQGRAAAPVAAAPAPAAAPAVAAKPATVKPGSLVVENPQTLPAQLIAKAEAAVAAHNSTHAASTDEVLTPSTTPALGTTATAPEVAPAIVPPPVAPAPVEVVPPPEPSAAFRTFVVNLKVSGVFQGESARAMFNGKMYRLGEILDSKLGIVFARIDPETKHLIFEDAKGATMSRRY